MTVTISSISATNVQTTKATIFMEVGPENLLGKGSAPAVIADGAYLRLRSDFIEQAFQAVVKNDKNAYIPALNAIPKGGAAYRDQLIAIFNSSPENFDHLMGLVKSRLIETITRYYGETYTHKHFIDEVGGDGKAVYAEGKNTPNRIPDPNKSDEVRHLYQVSKVEGIDLYKLSDRPQDLPVGEKWPAEPLKSQVLVTENLDAICQNGVDQLRVKLKTDFSRILSGEERASYMRNLAERISNCESIGAVVTLVNGLLEMATEGSKLLAVNELTGRSLEGNKLKDTDFAIVTQSGKIDEKLAEAIQNHAKSTVNPLAVLRG